MENVSLSLVFSKLGNNEAEDTGKLVWKGIGCFDGRLKKN